MNGRHHKTWEAEQYYMRNYTDHLPSTKPADTTLNLYPGHATYSGLTWQPATPDIQEETAGCGAWLTSDLRPESDKAPDLAHDLLADKAHTLAGRIGHVAHQLAERTKLRDQNLYDIDLAMMKRKTELYRCELWPPGANKIIERRRSQLEKDLQQMEKEKRLEQVASWRDRQMLLKELRNTLDDYRAASRRKDLLGAPYGPQNRW